MKNDYAQRAMLLETQHVRPSAFTLGPSESRADFNAQGAMILFTLPSHCLIRLFDSAAFRQRLVRPMKAGIPQLLKVLGSYVPMSPVLFRPLAA